MSIWSSLNEAFRVKKLGSMEYKIDDSLPDSIQKANFSQLEDFVKDLWKLAKTREDVKMEIEEMSRDSLIASAMELLADDSTQTDPVRNKSVWVTSEDSEISEYLNAFLEDIAIEDKIWTWAYQVIKYGDLFLKTYHSEFVDGTRPEELKDLKGYVFEKVEDPTSVSDLQKYDFTVGYETRKEKDKVVIWPVEDYIHFINDRMGKRDRVTLDFNKGEKLCHDEFKIRYGTCAFDAARQAWAMMSLIEMLLLYVRFGRSAFYRIFKVEVGAASRNEIIRILREVKASFSVQDNIDVNTKSYKGVKKPIPHGENVYLPVKQGKGDITIDTVGGDFDISDIVDLDYWRNKLFAALKMPKAYLGFEETQPGGLGNISLTRQDIRYARSVKVIKRILQNGIYDIIDFHLKELGKDNWIGLYSVEMTKVMSAETSDIEENLLSEISLAEALKNLLGESEEVDQKELMKVIINDILALSDKFPTLFGKEETNYGSSRNPPEEEE